jgi:hypothetical protein
MLKFDPIFLLICYSTSGKQAVFLISSASLVRITHFLVDNDISRWEVSNSSCSITEAVRSQFLTFLFWDCIVYGWLNCSCRCLQSSKHYVCFPKLTKHLPPRTIGYPWTLVYGTGKHGTSLKTLYRTMTGLDTPVLMVIKDSDGQVWKSNRLDPFSFTHNFELLIW